MLKGIDIAHYQGQPDFQRVKGDADFVIIKATEGTGFKDPEFDRNQLQARAAGLLVGYYHFAKGGDATAEADYFCSIAKPQLGEILCLDFEISIPNPTVWCKTFLDRVSSKFNGYKSLLYLNKSIANGNDWSAVIKGNYGLWIASYDGNQTGIPKTAWSNTAMKQYSSSGKVSGISGNVDMDTFFGEKDTFIKYGITGGVMAGTITVQQSDWDRLLKGSQQGDKLINGLSGSDLYKGNIADKTDDQIKQMIQEHNDNALQSKFDAGKSSVPPAVTPQPSEDDPNPDQSKWKLNGLTVVVTKDGVVKNYNYALK